MPRRTSPADGAAAPAVRVVVVTMDSHLASAAARAGESLRADIPGLELAVHAADEWCNDDAALAACRDDIARGDIVVATMLFLEEHIRAVLPIVQAEAVLGEQPLQVLAGAHADTAQRRAVRGQPELLPGRARQGVRPQPAGDGEQKREENGERGAAADEVTIDRHGEAQHHRLPFGNERYDLSPHRASTPLSC